MTVAEKIKEIESKIAELNIRMSSAGGGGGGAHNFLSATHPDTDPDSPVRGDIVRGIAGPEWQRYAIGAAGRFLRSDGVDPSWDTIQVGDLPAHAAEHEIGGGDLVDHDNLTNFVANEHIDHTAVTLTAGEGLQGGGTIAANRTFDLDINGLVEDAGATSGDFFVYYDTVDGVHYKIDSDDLPGGGASPWTVNGADIYWDGGGVATIGTIDHDSKITEGLNLYQGASDDLILAFQSSDIAHGITTLCDTDTYGFIKKTVGASGGLTIYSLSELFYGFEIIGVVTSDIPARWTQTNAAVIIEGKKKSGTGTTYISNNDMVFAVFNANYPRFIVDGEGNAYVKKVLFIYDTDQNTKMDQGITIQQSGYDNEALAIKSTDVSQPYTTPHEADTYAAFQKYVASEGGLSIQGMSEVTVGIELKGGGDTDNTTKSAAGIAPIILNATKSAAGTWGAVGADGNLVAIRNNDSSVWIVDEDGDVWQNGVIHIPNMKSGANQAAAGAVAGELWHDTDDDTVKMGV